MSKICRNCGNMMNDSDISCTRCGFAAPVEAKPAGWTPVRICVLVAAAILILATVLPYASAVGISFSLLSGGGDGYGDGMFFIAIAVVCIIFTVLNKQIVELICGIAACALALFELVDWNSAMSEMGQWSSLVSKGAGFYLMFVGAIAMLVLSIVHFLQSRN